MKPKLLSYVKSNSEKFSRKLVGSQIRIGEKILIPVVELSAYSHGYRAGEGDLQVIGFVLTPIEIVVVEDQSEWVLSLQEGEVET